MPNCFAGLRESGNYLWLLLMPDIYNARTGVKMMLVVCVRHANNSVRSCIPTFTLYFRFIRMKKKKKRLCDDYIDEWRKCLSENQYLSLEQWLSYIDAENSQVSIYADESREIIRKISLKTYESDYKIMIIWLPELMNPVCCQQIAENTGRTLRKDRFFVGQQSTR